MKYLRVNDPKVAGVAQRARSGKFAAVALGPGSLHPFCYVELDGQRYQLGAGELLTVAVRDQVEVFNALNASDSFEDERMYPFFANGVGAWQNIPDADVGNGVRGMVSRHHELELVLFECLDEARAHAPLLLNRRPLRIFDQRSNWTNAAAHERYQIPVAGRRFVTLKMRTTAGDSTVEIIGRTMAGTSSEADISLESGISVSTTTIGRVIEVEDFDNLVVKGAHGSEAGSTQNFRLWATAGGYAQGGVT